MRVHLDFIMTLIVSARQLYECAWVVRQKMPSNDALG